MLLARPACWTIFPDTPTSPQAQRAEKRRSKIRRFTPQPVRDIRRRFRIRMLHAEYVMQYTCSYQETSHGKNRKKSAILLPKMHFATETSLATAGIPDDELSLVSDGLGLPIRLLDPL